MQFISSSTKQTFSFAKKFASQLKGGEILGLVGPLGAGKTVFVKGLAAGLGIKKKITSPTFVLMKIYPLKLRGKPAIKNLVHLDAYRIKQAKELLAIGVKDYIGHPDAVTVIEWAEKIKKILPKKARIIEIKHKTNNIRCIVY